MSLIDLREGLGYEVLEMNSHGMYNCQNTNLDEAEAVLLDALGRLQQEEQANQDDVGLNDRLKAVTLNNLGVVYCHKGQPRKALERLDTAHSLELRLGVGSPSTTLNLCAAHNAMKHYEKATQLALQTIEALHRVPSHELEDHKVLWGAAWHNLGVAQVNMIGDKSKDVGENSAVFSIFKNSMRATQDLLGPSHPMTIAVHETFRELREKLKQNGVFLQHHTLPGLSERDKELTVTLIGSDRYKYHQTTPANPYRKPDRPGTQGSGQGASPRKPQTASQRFSERLNKQLSQHDGVYSERHPLIAAQYKAKRRANTSGSPRGCSPRGPNHGLGGTMPSPPRTGPVRNSGGNQQNRRLSELLMGDMWVEVHGSSTQSMMNTLPQHGQQGGAQGGVPQPPQKKDYYPPVRPSYGQAMHVMQPDHDMVIDPAANPQLDHQEGSKPPGSAGGGSNASGGSGTNKTLPALAGQGKPTEQQYAGLSALHEALNQPGLERQDSSHVRELVDSPSVRGARGEVK